MLLRSIRPRLLGLVLATVLPFTALIGLGVWQRWHDDQTAAIQRAVNEARLLAVQVDDHIGNLANLLTGLSEAVSTNPADVAANDALLRRVKAELPSYIANILLFAPDGTNIGTSAHIGRFFCRRSQIRPAGLGRSASGHRRRRPRPHDRRMGGDDRTTGRGSNRTTARDSCGRHRAQTLPERAPGQGPAARQHHQHCQRAGHRHRAQCR